MKKLSLFALVLFLVVAASADACLGQRSGRFAERRADRLDRRASRSAGARSTQTTRSVTTVRMSGPAVRFQLVPMQMGSGCPNGQCNVPQGAKK